MQVVAILPLIASWCSGHRGAIRRLLCADARRRAHVVIDGQPHSGFCYSTYDMSAGNLERRAAQFAEAGCDIFNFVVEISGYGYSRPLWPEKDRWDFSDLDERAHRILAVVPQALLLPRIYIDAPAWWCRENPQELLVLDDGSTSFADDSVRTAATRQLSLARIDQVARGHAAGAADRDRPHRAIGLWRPCHRVPAVRAEDGRMVSLDDELRTAGRLQPADAAGVSSVADAEIRQLADTAGRLEPAGRFLGDGADSQLRRRVGNRQRTFRDVHTERHVIDFHTFWSDVMADTIDLFARTVKEATRGTKIVGAFYAYTFEFAELGEDAGHLAVGRLLRSPHIDFLMAPSSYFDRNLPGKPYFRAPVQSLVLHGKMCWNDFDQVSFKYYDKLKANPNLKTWEYQMGLTRTPEEFVWMNRREIGMALGERRPDRTLRHPWRLLRRSGHPGRRETTGRDSPGVAGRGPHVDRRNSRVGRRAIATLRALSQPGRNTRELPEQLAQRHR